jgi:hypothetical protein
MAKLISLIPVDREYKQLLASFNKMDEIAKKDMKDIAKDLAERGAAYAKGSANNAPYNVKQARAVAQSIKVSKSDKAPSFSIGGRQKVSSSAFSAGYVIMGNEFGSKNYKQFPRRSPKLGRGNRGWWLYPAMTRFQPTIAREWLKGYEKIRDAWVSRLF